MIRGSRLGDTVSRRLTEIVAGGRTGRGPSLACRDDVWSDALDLIGGKERIAVISGFYIPSVSAPETDGPLGAFVLARALSRVGHHVEVWTDSFCLNCFIACGGAIGWPDNLVRDVSLDPARAPDVDLYIYVERPGRASDGLYYNMRKEDITEWTASLDCFAVDGDAPVLGIGDGGNEVGMGSIVAVLRDLMPDYARCLCVVESDVCIPADVSNWGALAVTSALSVAEGVWLGQSDAEDRLMFDALSKSGAVDGVTGERVASVDGLCVEEHLRIRMFLEGLISAE
ncbi:MAG: DUF4392 domain-containing protein [Synergistaceae bacterium]|nr:DUF4392 domain-containing protein [Synergistaceae bacterium]